MNGILLDTSAYLISEPLESDAPACFALVKKVFDECVAPDYSAEGIASYYQFITPEFVRNWRQENRICLVAKRGDAVIGIIDVRDAFHITSFFVDVAWHKLGVGRRLFLEALGACMRKNPAVARIEVHSSPFAVKAYSRLGFMAKGGEQEINGIRFTTMEFNVTEEIRSMISRV